MFLKKQNKTKQIKNARKHVFFVVVLFFCVSVVGIVRLIFSLFNAFKTIDIVFAYSLWSYVYAYILSFASFITYLWFKKK